MFMLCLGERVCSLLTHCLQYKLINTPLFLGINVNLPCPFSVPLVAAFQDISSPKFGKHFSFPSCWRNAQPLKDFVMPTNDRYKKRRSSLSNIKHDHSFQHLSLQSPTKAEKNANVYTYLSQGYRVLVNRQDNFRLKRSTSYSCFRYFQKPVTSLLKPGFVSRSYIQLVLSVTSSKPIPFLPYRREALEECAIR